jgi:hypothetical protein
MSDGFYFRKGLELFWSWPIASGTVVEVGDLLANSSGKAVRMATTTDNLNFIGPSKDAHGATDPSTTIQVYMPVPVMVHEYPLDAATDVVIGNGLQWNAAQVLKKSDTTAIAVAVESKLQATVIRCVFRMPAATSTQIRMIGNLS